ncbi:MAG: hypothetical protein N3A38_10080 [Planctomycetota bacterium]|nr:hypothetical protein [Planctomycetota bacterium]
MVKLKADLARHDIELIMDITGKLPERVGARHSIRFAGGKMRHMIYVRPGVSRYEMFHELLHARHAREMGIGYLNLSKGDRELYVYRKMRSIFWEVLSEEERKSARRYIKEVLKEEGVCPDIIEALIAEE